VGLRCHLGDLVDLSTTGLRLRRLGKPQIAVGTVLPVVVQNETQSVSVNARVVWIRKVGGITSNEWHVGAAFNDLRPGIIKALEQFAMFGWIQTTPPEWETKAGPAQPKPAASGAGSANTSASGAGKSNQEQPSGNAKPNVGVHVEDLYSILGVAPGASAEIIRAAYHVLAKQMHPDRSTAPDAAERFATVNKAYGVLRDPESRKRYDALIKQSKPAA
jgi:pyruvate/2-oxoglutarate dehydrogenase complex dihydrolipoamide acyltransferase (E2) component